MSQTELQIATLCIFSSEAKYLEYVSFFAALAKISPIVHYIPKTTTDATAIVEFYQPRLLLVDEQYQDIEIPTGTEKMLWEDATVAKVKKAVEDALFEKAD